MLLRSDLFSDADFDAAVGDKLLNVRPSGDGQLILNYSKAAAVTPGAFENPAVRICRGLITTDSPRPVVIARPWAKFFNYGQPEADLIDLHEPVEVTDKVDGSLGIIHLDAAGQPRVASRGSFTSEQALHATALLRAHPEWLPDPRVLQVFTILVEIVYPENRIVLDYGAADELTLLGAVHITPGYYHGPNSAARYTGWAGPRAVTFDRYPTLLEALHAPPRPNAEGLVVRALGASRPDPVRDALTPAPPVRVVKIKQADYIALHKIVTNLSEKVVWEHLKEGDPLEDLLAQLPDELHLWTRAVAGRLTDQATATLQRAQQIKELIEGTLPGNWTRKEFAADVRTFPGDASNMFALADGRDPYPAIFDRLKPVGATRARATTEDVA